MRSLGCLSLLKATTVVLCSMYNTGQLTVFQFQGCASTMEPNLKRNAGGSNMCVLLSTVIG